MAGAELLDNTSDQAFRLSTSSEFDLMQTGMGLKSGIVHGRGDTDEDALSGSWSFQSRKNGIRMHCGSFRSLKDMTMFFELPPGLSLTLVFEGSVRFAMGASNYTLGKTFQPVEAAGFSVARPEVITRHFTRGECVKKLNVFVERDWLESFCHCEKERNDLSRVFSASGQIKRWRPDLKTLAAADNLMNLGTEHGMVAELERESTALQLVSLMLAQYLVVPGEQPEDATVTVTDKGDPGPVKQFLDELDGQLPGLEDLAAKFNVSVSTLQRRFKSRYGVTVIDYMRQKKLDDAKLLLVENRLSIGEIAYLSGYKHPSNFNSAFIKRFNVSPGSFRNLHLQNQ